MNFSSHQALHVAIYQSALLETNQFDILYEHEY